MLITGEGSGDLEFLTWKPDTTGASDPVSPSEAFEEIAARLGERQAVVLQERIFGELVIADEALALRQRAYQAHGIDLAVPPTWVEGRPCTGAGVAGIHVIAVRPAADGARAVAWNGTPCGWLVRGDSGWYLGLANVGRMIPGVASLAPGEETERAFRLCEGILAEVGWSFRDVRRTWFFLHDILDWYDEFNRVRNAEFRRMGLLDPEHAQTMPASTGIFGRGLTGNRCILDLLAIRALDGHAFRVRRLFNPSQNEAPEYGSAFARGLAVTAGRGEYLFVSGTAAIDDSGESVHLGDLEGQTWTTLDTVRSLLAPAGAGLEDICQATAFVKPGEDVGRLLRVMRDLGLPIVCTVADVCRPELLFELDAAVVRPAPTAPGADHG